MPSNGKTIAVIGAGAAGLAAAKYLLAEGCNVVIFEQKTAAGGVWNTEAGNTSRGPVYEGLETNVPRTLMTFSDFAWPEDTSLFPKSASVKQYLQSYAANLQEVKADDEVPDLKIHYNTKVIDVRRSTMQKNNCWRVVTHQASIGGECSAKAMWFQAVVVAIGNYHSPHVPKYEGMDEWYRARSGTMFHSVSYRKPEYFAGETVLVVGNSASGWDISSQLAGVAAKVIVSSNRFGPLGSVHQLSAQYLDAAPGVHSFDHISGRVTFVNGVSRAVTKVIFCTGYKYDFSFIKKGTASGDELLFPSGVAVKNVYKHIFYTDEQTLAFVGLPTMSAAFTVAEAQSVVIARVFSERLTIPSKPACRKWYEEASQAHEERVRAGQADERHYHSFRLTADKEYVNDLLQ